ncbi:ParB N-terminal domain-containing protein [uncultured Roseobacter sp.]|uniref:ParB N-terminal domain-containing protein n=1 Tax=uncultured Roseobacter sp. TaxID=114847 RepID=UPI00263074D1|nr:ParB N-terminal domain-containing protein [uncultured Roseobacter sp.]
MTQDEDYILIRQKRIPAVARDIPHADLRFWPDNPRVYSLLDRRTAEPDQDAIFRSMLKLEHVRALRHDILDNGGLIDPIIVRDGDFVVIEGNSRLAAYRSLASDDPTSWNTIRCRVLPANIQDADVYAMLGQYHVKGKKDWAPYEKAGFVYRRHVDQKVDIPDVARELGVSPQQIRHLVDVFQFMKDNGDDNRERWSHYDEFLKSRKIKKARDEIADFESHVVGLIKSGTIRAVDVRDQLPTICQAPKILKKFAKGDLQMDDAFTDARHAGGDSVELSKVKRFRSWICEPDILDEMAEHNAGVRQKIDYELKKIEARISTIRDQLEKSKAQ